MVISVKLPKRSLNLVRLYRPPGLLVSELLDDYSSLVKFVQSLAPDPVFVGDCNIDVGKSSSKVANIVAQHIYFLAHLKGGILDHIITPNDSHLIDSVRISDCMSDHMCLLVRFNCGTDAVVPATHISNIRKRDMPKFKHDLLNSELLKGQASSLGLLYDQYSTV